MADVYKRKDFISLINKRHILLIGDSNIRALYKDLVWLYKFNTLIDVTCLKRRLEQSYLGDRLLSRSELTRGRDFSEHRIFEDGGTTIEFLFVTRCYCKKLTDMLKDIKNGNKHCPDVILMNSCLWDVSRWGPNGVRDYKVNMENLMKLLSTSLPKHVLFIWATALPIAALTSGGLLIKQIEFLQAVLRIHVVEANNFTAGLVSSYGFDVLDFHHYMRYQIIRRSADGVHFLPPAMRFLTNLLLTHIALSWDIKLPGNLKNLKDPLADKIFKALEASAGSEASQTLKKIEVLAETLKISPSDSYQRRKKKRNNKFHNIRITFNRALAHQPPPHLTKYIKPSPKKSKPNTDIGHKGFLGTYPNFLKEKLPPHNLSDTIQQLYNTVDTLQTTINSFHHKQYENSFSNSQFASYKDFRLVNFDDFCRVSNQNRWGPSILPMTTESGSSYCQIDRFYNYQNHPYRNSNYQQHGLYYREPDQAGSRYPMGADEVVGPGSYCWGPSIQVGPAPLRITPDSLCPGSYNYDRVGPIRNRRKKHHKW